MYQQHNYFKSETLEASFEEEEEQELLRGKFYFASNANKLISSLTSVHFGSPHSVEIEFFCVDTK